MTKDGTKLSVIRISLSKLNKRTYGIAYLAVYSYLYTQNDTNKLYQFRLIMGTLLHASQK
ncbi:MAG: hypothetical protein ACOH2V_01600 [Candidatus Saccharimonadaceae bacterium]